MERPERIVLFAKFSNCLAGHGDPIIRPAITSELDYEGELAVIIGQRAVNMRPAGPSTTSAATRSSTMSQHGTCRAPSRGGSGARRWTRSPRSGRSSSTRPPPLPSPR